ncbi:MAG: hypothetical protein RL427_726 [Bacteroidota bacterium]|jgi:hypothetical protein
MDYLNFRSTNKSSLSEFNLEENRGWMIDRMTQIEIKIDTIITEYFEPGKKKEFEKIILNSSIISMGSKSKILRNVHGFDKNIITKIQKISSIRNAFAHMPVSENINVNIIEDQKGSHIGTKIDVTSVIEVMNSSGELIIKNSKEQVLEFFDLQFEIINYLNNCIHHK